MHATHESGSPHLTDNGRRSPWLALGAFAFLTGCLAVAAFLVFLGSTREPDQNRLLDSLERDARAVTPIGTLETTLSRYACGKNGINTSAPTSVVRKLHVSAANGSVRDAVINGYVGLGWHRSSQQPNDIAEHGQHRDVYVEESGDGRSVTVRVEDTSILC